MNAQLGWWRPTGTLARTLMWLFGANAVLQLAMLAEGTPRVFDGYASALHAALNGHDRLAQQRLDNLSPGSDEAVLQIAGLLSVALLVVLVIWQWRSVNNANALQRTGARISPGWVIAGWLVPVANLFMPYLSFQDLARNTDPRAEPGSHWRSLPGSPLVASFWITYVVGSITPAIVVVAVLATSVNAADTDAYTIVGHLSLAAASAMGIFVVRQLTDRQEQQHASTPVADRRPVWAGAGASSGGGGWHPDPLARFDYRYWDGAIWTDWVSTDGRMSIDPQPVPGYESPGDESPGGVSPGEDSPA
ncbi:MAG: DUF4328 domain-containing protein [Acidimicrobiia bacterium]